jgi:hypothetical protein
MVRALAALFLLLVPAAPALAQPLDGTWAMFRDPADAELASIEAAGGRLPADDIDGLTRIEFAAGTATVHAGETTIGMTVTATETEWGYDAQVSGLTGTAAPITFLRVERATPDRATLTTYTGQTPLESFAIVRVVPEG